MSKSKGNVINPDELVKEFGADALRLYEMFMGPFDQAIAWDKRGILGTERFLKRVWELGVTRTNADMHADKRGRTKNTLTTSSYSQVFKDVGLVRLLHKTLKKVSEDIESMSFNTAVSTMMELVNELSSFSKGGGQRPEDFSPFRKGGAGTAGDFSNPSLLRGPLPLGKGEWEMFLKMLAPFAPHIAEELWMQLGNKKSIHLAEWPKFDPKLLVESTFELVIQINSKVRDRVSVPMGITQADAEKLVLARAEVKKWVTSTPKKVIFVKDRLINFIVA